MHSMEQDLHVAAPQARVSWMHATTIHSTSKDLSCAEAMLQPGTVSAQVDAECLDILKIGNTESRPFPDGQDSTPCSDTDSAAMDSKMLQVSPIHHLNFFRQPVYHKCATPPATSLAVLMSQRQGIADFDKSICKATIVCQAMCFLDPVAYWGSHETLKELRGTALKEAVTGQCAKLYTTDGIWRDDLWDEDEDEPFSYNDTANTDVLFDGERSYGLAPSEQDFINRLHCTGGLMMQSKVHQQKENFLRQPCSRLREVVCADDGD